MAGSKEIIAQINSVQKTQKITSAMQLVSASKMGKAQDRMNQSKLYATKMNHVIGHLANSHPEYRHPFLVERDIKKVGYIVITSDRGLCGSLNNGLLKSTLQDVKKWHEKGVETEFCLIGNKAVGFFRRFGGDIIAKATHLGDSPSISQLIGVVSAMLENYTEGRIDALMIARNEFVNTMSQQPVVQQLLPLARAQDESRDYYWDYIYEPDAREVIDRLLRRYLESQVYQAVIENIACEHASRMVAMKSATENAGELIEKLRLAYNKARQAAITQEIAEIVSGADAV